MASLDKRVSTYINLDGAVIGTYDGETHLQDVRDEMVEIVI